MRYVLMLTAILVLTGCNSATADILISGPWGEERRMTVELADTPEERETGLMFRESLATDTGMLFVFEDEAERSFWMQNTQIALDILFFDANGEFVSRTSMTPCVTPICMNYSSIRPAKYALEVVKGQEALAPVTYEWTLSYK